MKKGTLGKNSILAIVLLAYSAQAKKFSLAHPAILHQAFESYGRRLTNATDFNDTEEIIPVQDSNDTEKINWIPHSPGPIDWPEPMTAV